VKAVLTAAFFSCASCRSESDEAPNRASKLFADSAQAVAIAGDEYVRQVGLSPHLEWFRRDGNEFVMRFNAGPEAVGGGARIRVTAQGGAVLEELTQ
jgi:hypothetical protein